LSKIRRKVEARKVDDPVFPSLLTEFAALGFDGIKRLPDLFSMNLQETQSKVD